MTSFTFADHKLGGRLTAAADAIGAGHLRRAAGIFNEVADDLNAEAEAATGLLAEDDGPTSPINGREILDRVAAALTPPPQLATSSAPADLQMCGRNVHSYGASDPTSGWRTCSICGVVNVAPPEGNGAIDMSIRQ